MFVLQELCKSRSKGVDVIIGWCLAQLPWATWRRGGSRRKGWGRDWVKKGILTPLQSKSLQYPVSFPGLLPTILFQGEGKKPGTIYQVRDANFYLEGGRRPPDWKITNEAFYFSVNSSVAVLNIYIQSQKLPLVSDKTVWWNPCREACALSAISWWATIEWQK